MSGIKTTSSFSKALFTEEMLPSLQGVPLSAMAEPKRLSEGYFSFIKQGINPASAPLGGPSRLSVEKLTRRCV